MRIVRSAIQFLQLVVLLLGCVLFVSAHSSVPEGFEILSQPQDTVADFYYGDRYLASLPVTYTPTALFIQNPELLASLIPYVSKRSQVQTALTGELPSNPDLICVSSGDTDCGHLEPEVAGVIHNAGLFRVDVFVAPEFLATRTLVSSRYLTESSSGPGLLQGLSLTTSGVFDSENDQSNYTLSGSSVAGWRETHLIGNWNYNKKNDLSIDELYLARDKMGLEAGGGYLDSNSNFNPEFSSGQRILGMRMGSSMQSRTSDANATATVVQIFASSRGRVEVFRDDTLIYASMIEAGSQQLNTSSFPNGSYQITVRVYSGSAVTQEFTRFFVKSVQLPPPDELLWHIEAGEMTYRASQQALPEKSGTWLMRGSLNTRVARSTGLKLMASGTGTDTGGEAQIYHQGRNWHFKASGLIGSSNVHGAALQTSFNIRNIATTYNYRRLWNDHTEESDSGTFRLFGSSYENQSVSASSPLLGGYITFNHNYNRSATSSSRIDSVSWLYNIRPIGNYNFNLQFDFSQSDNNKQAMARLNISRLSRNWQHGATFSTQWVRDDKPEETTAESYVLDSRWRGNDLETGYAEAGLAYEKKQDFESLRGNARYEASRFATDWNIDRQRQGNGEDSTGYTGRLDTNFAFNTSGAGFGGSRISKSAIIIKVDGSPDATFDVLVNGNVAGFVRGNTSTVVPLAPFATYRVSMRPRGEGFHDYDQRVRSITLYPGNIETVEFKSEKILVLVGRLVDENGEALTNAAMGEGRYLTRTNEHGIFQISIPDSALSLQITLADEQQCNAVLPGDYTERGGVGLVGSLECL